MTFYVKFEVLEEVKTGRITSGFFFGGEEETEERWTPKEAIVTPMCYENGSVILFADGRHAYLDLNPELVDDGVHEVLFSYADNIDWKDVKNVKIETRKEAA